MRLRLAVSVGLVGVGLIGCRDAQTTDSDRTAAMPRTSAPTTATPGAAGASAVGLPVGYRTRVDDPRKSSADIKYSTNSEGMLDVNAGTHDQNLGHVLYRDADSASGTYVVRTEIDQLSAPEHAEAIGVLIGGRDLAAPGQRYGYFIVRGDGQYSVKRRDGDSVYIVVPFTTSVNIPKADAARHAKYPLTVRVAADSVRFLVAEKQVAAVARGAIPTDGVAGFRINHGLHVIVTPLAISR